MPRERTPASGAMRLAELLEDGVVCARRSPAGTSVPRAAGLGELLLGLVVVVVRVFDAALELALRLTEVAGELGELRTPEDEKHDHQDDDQLGSAKVHADEASGSGPPRPGGQVAAT